MPFQKGHKGYWFGKKRENLSWIGKPMSEEHKRKIGLANSIARKGKPSNAKGKKYKISFEARIRKSIAQQKRVREGRNHLYKGGITNINQKIRHSLEYKLWREAVFKRDNWTCIWCSLRGVKLNADHIKPFAYYPELRFAIDNGRTLCVDCHKTTDTYKKKINNTK